MKKIILSLACAGIIISGCGNMSNLAKGSLIGAGSGAALGAAVGGLIGKDGKAAAIGAAIGTAVGTGAGAVIGNHMDKKAEELAALEGANVEVVTDANDLAAIRVTFDSGILFPLNGTTLNSESKKALAEFAEKMADMPETDITVYGHTDNTGSAEVNERISKQRADAVAQYLQSCSISKDRLTSEGKSFTMPVADNSTAEGRAQNRRVEVYISANATMVQQAENGTLQ